MQVYDALDLDGVIDAVAELLRSDGVAIIPTDTLYGFSGSLLSVKAYERIAAIKGDLRGRRYLTLAANIEMVRGYVSSWGCASRNDLEAMWPAALTAVLPANAERCPPWASDTIAIRIPNDESLRTLVAAVGAPLMSTSVNRSGDPPMTKRKAIVKEFESEVDALVRASKRDDAPQASTVVDLTGEKPEVLRRGSFLWPA